MSRHGVRCAFLGRLGAGASVRYPQEGALLARCSAAVHNVRAGTEASAGWVNGVHVGDLVDELAPRRHKGNFVYVKLRLRLAQWTNTDGVCKSPLDITVSRTEVLGVFTQQHTTVAWMPEKKVAGCVAGITATALR